MTTNFGNFSSPGPKTEWLIEGPERDRDMRLIEDFTYTDPDGKAWEARSGRTVNGASIPRALWITVGSPYTGSYRKASVVHDTACEDADIAYPGRGPNWDRDRLAADRMFRLACRAGGCNQAQALVMYLGVRAGAKLLAKGIQPPGGGIAIDDIHAISGERQWVLKTRPNLHQWDEVALHVISSLQDKVIAETQPDESVSDDYLDDLDRQIDALIP